ncbi:MAG: hypothetical protein AAGF23_04285 [Acidobacteriota bacterium]
MRMSKDERHDLRRRIREGREALRSRLGQELGRVDFKALRAQVRTAQAARAAQTARAAQAAGAAQADGVTPPNPPTISTAPGAAISEETRRRIARARDEAARSRARLQLESAAKTLTGGRHP